MGLKVKDPNGEWKETGGALKVIKVDDKVETYQGEVEVKRNGNDQSRNVSV